MRLDPISTGEAAVIIADVLAGVNPGQVIDCVDHDGETVTVALTNGQTFTMTVSPAPFPLCACCGVPHVGIDCVVPR